MALRQAMNLLTTPLLFQIAYIYIIDAPKLIYRCPLDNPQWTDENCYWSSSYAEAREKFLVLGNELKRQIKDGDDFLTDVRSSAYDVSDDLSHRYERYEDYLSAVNEESNPGPGGDAIDALLLTFRVPADHKAINVIHSCGVHGVEGYLGSAVQLRFMHELINQLRQQRSTQQSNHIKNKEYKQYKLLLLHSINPHGMRYHRRTNANNVDLNRNALSLEQWKYIRQRDPNFAGYVDLDWVLNPFLPKNATNDGYSLFSWEDSAKLNGYTGDVERLKRRDEEVRREAEKDSSSSKPLDTLNNLSLWNVTSIETGWFHESIQIVKLLPLLLHALLTMGYDKTKRAFVSSQYLKPSGSQYGGGNHLHHYDNWENSIFAVRHAIGTFAGLDAAEDIIFWVDVHTGLGKYGEYTMLSSRQKESPPEWVQSRLLSSHNDDVQNQQVSQGYDATLGFVNGPTLCPPPNCYARTQEFGTRPGILVGLAMVLENKGRFMGEDFSFVTSWAFYPRRLSWRRKALRGGMSVLKAALDF